MHFLRIAIVLLGAATALPTLGQDAPAEPATAPVEEGVAAPVGPVGTFVDEFGTSFTFSLCGEDGTALCGVLNTLEGESATEENLAFVGKQVMQAEASGPNQWKGEISAGGMSAGATITQTGPDTIDIEGCRAAVLCQTLTYTRAS